MSTITESLVPTGTRLEDTFDHGPLGRANAWFFHTFDRYLNHISRHHKRHAFGDLPDGTVVELGAGVGANFDYLPPGARVLAVEPNRAMHELLERRARYAGVGLDIVGSPAERLPFDDGSVDEVFCSLVLCTVGDPDRALAEIRRVLRPGGRFRFVEHVAAPAWSPRRWLQHAIRRPWRYVFEGCDLCRDTATTVQRAGFSAVAIERRRFRRSAFVPVNSAIWGVAVR
jgi:SAM-dependent methyltransferase